MSRRCAELFERPTRATIASRSLRKQHPGCAEIASDVDGRVRSRLKVSRWRSARAMSSALCPALFTLVLCAAFAVSCGAKHDLSGTLIVPLILDDYAVAAKEFWVALAA